MNQVSKSRGILGTIEAFGDPDKEQGCGTLNSHWSIQIKEMSCNLREMIFLKDKKEGHK